MSDWLRAHPKPATDWVLLPDDLTIVPSIELQQLHSLYTAWHLYAESMKVIADEQACASQQELNLMRATARLLVIDNPPAKNMKQADIEACVSVGYGVEEASQKAMEDDAYARAITSKVKAFENMAWAVRNELKTRQVF